jgi:endonuclease YncB( thermonuclease family)
MMARSRLTGYRKHILATGTAVFIVLIVFLRTWNSGEHRQREIRGPVVPIRMDKSAIRLDDGDTVFYRDLPIRILGIDAPEIVHKEHGIFEDQAYGREAAAMTMDMIKRARVIEYLPFQSDKYGRLLAHIFVDGDLLSVRLIRAGLAYENVSYYGDNGFPNLADRILKAACQSPRPRFEEPYKWRRKHQIRR